MSQKPVFLYRKCPTAMATVTPDVAALAEEQPTVPSTIMEAAADAGAAASDSIQSTEPSASAAAEDKKVICRRCNQETAEEDALCQEKFRLDLRWTCKACHALLTQLNRHGVELKTVLSETESVNCKAARMNAVDKRLSYTQARGVLKQSMIESASRVSTEVKKVSFSP